MTHKHIWGCVTPRMFNHTAHTLTQTQRYSNTDYKHIHRNRLLRVDQKREQMTSMHRDRCKTACNKLVLIHCRFARCLKNNNSAHFSNNHFLFFLFGQIIHFAQPLKHLLQVKNTELLCHPLGS